MTMRFCHLSPGMRVNANPLLQVFKPRAMASAAITLALISGPAVAQDFSSYGDMGMSMGSATVDNVIADVTLIPNLPSRTPRGSVRDATRVDGASARFDYAPSQAAKKQALAGYVARIARQDPTAAKAVAQVFARQDAGRIYAAIAGSFGMRDNDVADILTSYTVLGFLIATGAPDPSRESVIAARNQIAAGIANDTRFADPRARAGLGEELKLLFVTVHAGWQSARREGTLKQYSDLIASQWVKQSGKNLRTLQLNSKGFGRR